MTETISPVSSLISWRNELFAVKNIRFILLPPFYIPPSFLFHLHQLARVLLLYLHRSLSLSLLFFSISVSNTLSIFIFIIPYISMSISDTLYFSHFLYLSSSLCLNFYPYVSTTLVHLFVLSIKQWNTLSIYYLRKIRRRYSKQVLKTSWKHVYLIVLILRYIISEIFPALKTFYGKTIINKIDRCVIWSRRYSWYNSLLQNAILWYKFEYIP